MAALNETSTDSAYVYGRLLALLEDIQYQAQGKLNNTIIDRFFSAATATPAPIITLLIRNAEKAHLPKIRRARGNGAYVALKDKIGHLNALIASNPYRKSLDLEEQSRFLLGYYLQRADTRARITSAQEKKKTSSEGENKE